MGYGQDQLIKAASLATYTPDELCCWVFYWVSYRHALSYLCWRVVPLQFYGKCYYWCFNGWTWPRRGTLHSYATVSAAVIDGSG